MNAFLEFFKKSNKPASNFRAFGRKSQFIGVFVNKFLKIIHATSLEKL